ncbi:MAG: phospho-sugar mutase, partial [Bacteroidota bacterium]
DNIAKKQGIEVFNTLTGFKYIAEVMRNNEGQKTFIGGGEESYGYLAGEFVRDKDAILACGLIAEMAAYAKDTGKSLFETLISIYQEYGFYLESLTSLKKEGKAGAEEIKSMMENFRSNPPESLGGSKVVMVKDYQIGISKDLISGEESNIDLSRSNVLQFFTEDGSKISARPSGTEPKIKFYFSVKTDLNSAEEFDATKEKLEARIEAIGKDLGM